jgi:hypothetical protein
MYSEQIELVVQYKTTTQSGVEIAESTATILGKKKSVNRTEFYAAYGVGLRLSHIWEIIPEEFTLADVTVNGKTYHATHIRYNGELYEIVRTYQVNEYALEITVQ